MINILSLKNLISPYLKDFATRLTQANLASKNYIPNFLKKKDCDDKLENLNQLGNSNKTKQMLVENKFNKFSSKINKRTNQNLINNYKILNDTKYFFSGIFQNYIVFYLQKLKNTLNFSVALSELVRENLMECQKKITLNQVASLHELLLVIIH